MIRCADRAANRVSTRNLTRVAGAKSWGQSSNARSWMVTTPGHGRTSGRKQLGAWTSDAPVRASASGSHSCSKANSGPSRPVSPAAPRSVTTASRSLTTVSSSSSSGSGPADAGDASARTSSRA